MVRQEYVRWVHTHVRPPDWGGGGVFHPTEGVLPGRGGEGRPSQTTAPLTGRLAKITPLYFVCYFCNVVLH